MTESEVFNGGEIAVRVVHTGSVKMHSLTVNNFEAGNGCWPRRPLPSEDIATYTPPDVKGFKT